MNSSLSYWWSREIKGDHYFQIGKLFTFIWWSFSLSYWLAPHFSYWWSIHFHIKDLFCFQIVDIGDTCHGVNDEDKIHYVNSGKDMALALFLWHGWPLECTFVAKFVFAAILPSSQSTFHCIMTIRARRRRRGRRRRRRREYPPRGWDYTLSFSPRV